MPSNLLTLANEDIASKLERVYARLLPTINKSKKLGQIPSLSVDPSQYAKEMGFKHLDVSSVRTSCRRCTLPMTCTVPSSRRRFAATQLLLNQAHTTLSLSPSSHITQSISYTTLPQSTGMSKHGTPKPLTSKALCISRLYGVFVPYE
eukprot:PhF_6_TR26712/c0_g1_i4/m.39074